VPPVKVHLLDVSFFTFRAYHALPPLSTAGGLPTNAVHGVAQMLERLFRTEKPSHVAACFDAPGPTFRSSIYPAYKANRKEPDEDLRRQFPYVRKLIEAMSLRCIEVPGFEADDILATLATRMSAHGALVIIVTGDKDLMQCVSENVELYDPIRELRVGPDQVVDKFGVPARAVVEVQGLMGDSVDNIPGVPGVGPKTAAALIRHFGSIAAMLERPSEIEALDIRGAARIREKILAHAEQARLSRALATVRTDVPVDTTLEDLRFQTLHTRELLELAEQLELGRLAVRIREATGMAASPEPTEIAPAAGGAADVGDPDHDVAFDADWTHLDGDECVFVCSTDQAGAPVIALQEGDRRVLLAGHGEICRAVRGLADREISLSGDDVKGLCRGCGTRPGSRTLDVGVASYLYDASVGEHHYPAVVERFLGEVPAARSAEPHVLAAALDQVSRLIPILRAALSEHEQAKLYRAIELPLIGVLAEIEAKGILLDVAMLAQISEEFRLRMADLVTRIYDAAGCEFNVLSPVQLREVLFTRLGLPVKGIKATKTGPSTDSETLEALATQHPLPGLVLEYRTLAKLKSTYLDALPRLVDEHSRIHTRLNQTVTATGRLSSSDPNLQNIPIRSDDGARIRRAFVSSPGCVLISADYNQIELRVLAHLSNDSALIEAFHAGRDIHAATASEVFDLAGAAVPPSMRRAAKVINFGIIYGMGSGRLSRELGITRQQAAAYIERYFARYAGVRRFYDRMLEHARQRGYVETMLGRRRYLPEILSDNGGMRQLAERVATNTPIQGSAADIIKVAMVRLSDRMREERLRADMVLQIHDELLVECAEGELKRALTVIRETMENAVRLVVPVVVDIGTGTSWAQAH
jgi:DNA polymerase I